MTFTKERLEQLANFRGASVTRQEEQELARIALTADEAIEVLKAARSYVKSCAGSDGHAFGVLRAIDRVCRTAMLAAAPQQER